ncbi:DUF58 domain-containing protein [Pseudoalteromonas atlantica]
MGINYQNNLILVMAYLMFVVMIIAVLLGYTNAKGLKVQYIKSFASFSPNKGSVKFILKAPTLTQSVSLGYSSDSEYAKHLTQVTPKDSALIINLPYNARGKYTLERFKIHSNYPFGLVSVWSYIQPNDSVYVYPAPEHVLNDTYNSTFEHTTQTGSIKEPGSEEFDELITHLPEMGLQRISWKHYAKSQQLLVKEFIDYKKSDIVFDFNLLTGNTEQRLSQLCFLVCNACENNTPFTLILPSASYKATNDTHDKSQCLALLSEYGGANNG